MDKLIIKSGEKMNPRVIDTNDKKNQINTFLKKIINSLFIISLIIFINEIKSFAASNLIVNPDFEIDNVAPYFIAPPGKDMNSFFKYPRIQVILCPL